MATKKRQLIDQAQPEARSDSGVDVSGLHLFDTYSWAKLQVKAMQNREYDKVDWEHVIEEIAEMAANREDQWVSNCARAVQHMYKILRWPTRLPRPERSVEKWRGEIDGGKKPYRERMAFAIRKNPGLKHDIEDLLAKAWEDGCMAVAEDFATAELGRKKTPQWRRRVREHREDLPELCPWTLVELAGYNPLENDKFCGPVDEVWPPEVAKVLNRVLKTDYPECGWDAEYKNGPAVRKDEIGKGKQRRGPKAKGKRGRAHQSMVELARESQAKQKQQSRSR